LCSSWAFTATAIKQIEEKSKSFFIKLYLVVKNSESKSYALNESYDNLTRLSIQNLKVETNNLASKHTLQRLMR
jgi:hypothetical protein